MTKRNLNIAIVLLFAAGLLFAAHTFDFLGLVRSIHGQ